MTGPPHQRLAAGCPSRVLYDQIADKSSMMILAVPDGGPRRFNAIPRRLEGVTQKALSPCPRRLRRKGLVARRVIDSSPIAVEYQITPLGRASRIPCKALHDWTLENMATAEMARSAFDLAAHEWD